MGSTSTVEGYVPFNRSNCKSKNGKQDSEAAQNNQKKHEDPMDFTSIVIIPDECKNSKLPPQTKQPSPIGLRREKERDMKNFGFVSFGFDAMPDKHGMPDSNMFDRDQSWFDGPPEGFSLIGLLLIFLSHGQDPVTL